MQSSKEKIRLKVIKTYIGQFYLSQIVLKPVREMKVGDTYKLMITTDEGKQAIQKWNSKKSKYDSVEYKIVDTKNYSDF